MNYLKDKNVSIFCSYHTSKKNFRLNVLMRYVTRWVWVWFWMMQNSCPTHERKIILTMNWPWIHTSHILLPSEHRVWRFQLISWIKWLLKHIPSNSIPFWWNSASELQCHSLLRRIMISTQSNDIAREWWDCHVLCSNFFRKILNE